MPIRVGADSLSEVQSHEIDNRGCRLALRIDDLAATVPSGSGRRTEGRDPHVVDSPVDEGQRRGPHPVRSARVRHVAVLLAPGWAQRGVHREEDVISGGGSTSRTPHSLFVSFRSGVSTWTFDPVASIWMIPYRLVREMSKVATTTDRTGSHSRTVAPERPAEASVA